MTHPAMRHPRSLTSLAIIRDKSEYSKPSTILSAAIFTVTRSRQCGAQFAIEHCVFDRTVTRAQILDDIADQIPSGVTLIAKAPRMPQHHRLPSLAFEEPLPPADLQLIQRTRPDLDVLPLDCSAASLEEAATAYSITRARPGSSVLAKARGAPAEAQCLWLTFLWSLCRKSDRTMLGSAWEAWRALERARSIPF